MIFEYFLSVCGVGDREAKRCSNKSFKMHGLEELAEQSEMLEIN